MTMMSAPRPVKTPPTEVATRLPCLEFGHRLPLRREAGREEPAIPVAGDDPPAIARQLVGEVLRITDAQELGARVVAEAPGRKADRGQVPLLTPD